MRAADLLPQEDEVSRDKYHELVNRVMHFKENQDQKDIRHFLELELAEANEYYRQIVADEELWISQNADVETLFQAKYYASKDDQVRLNSHADLKQVINLNRVNTFAEVGVFVAIALLLFASICLYFLRRFLKKIAHQTTNKV